MRHVKRRPAKARVTSRTTICDAGSGPVDYVSIGCPHLALDELKTIADYLRGKKVHSGVELLIWTSYATKARLFPECVQPVG